MDREHLSRRSILKIGIASPFILSAGSASADALPERLVTKFSGPENDSTSASSSSDTTVQNGKITTELEWLQSSQEFPHNHSVKVVGGYDQIAYVGSDPEKMSGFGITSNGSLSAISPPYTHRVRFRTDNGDSFRIALFAAVLSDSSYFAFGAVNGRLQIEFLPEENNTVQVRNVDYNILDGNWYDLRLIFESKSIHVFDGTSKVTEFEYPGWDIAETPHWGVGASDNSDTVNCVVEKYTLSKGTVFPGDSYDRSDTVVSFPLEFGGVLNRPKATHPDINDTDAMILDESGQDIPEIARQIEPFGKSLDESVSTGFLGSHVWDDKYQKLLSRFIERVLDKSSSGEISNRTAVQMIERARCGLSLSEAMHGCVFSPNISDPEHTRTLVGVAPDSLMTERNTGLARELVKSSFTWLAALHLIGRAVREVLTESGSIVNDHIINGDIGQFARDLIQRHSEFYPLVDAVVPDIVENTVQVIDATGEMNGDAILDHIQTEVENRVPSGVRDREVLSGTHRASLISLDAMLSDLLVSVEGNFNESLAESRDIISRSDSKNPIPKIERIARNHIELMEIKSILDGILLLLELAARVFTRTGTLAVKVALEILEKATKLEISRRSTRTMRSAFGEIHEAYFIAIEDIREGI